MLYQAYQNQSDLMSPLRLLAQMTGSQMATQHAGAGLMAQLIGLSPFLPPASTPSSQRKLAAAMEVFSRMRLTHSRPAFGITSVVSGGEEVAVNTQQLPNPEAGHDDGTTPRPLRMHHDRDN